MSDFSIGFGATSPDLIITVKDASGAAIDVSTMASAKIRARKIGGGQQPGALDINAAMSKNTDGSDGKLKFTFSTAQASKPGHYAASVLVDMGSGKLIVFPSEGFLDLLVGSDIGTVS